MIDALVPGIILPIQFVHGLKLVPQQALKVQLVVNCRPFKSSNECEECIANMRKLMVQFVEVVAERGH